MRVLRTMRLQGVACGLVQPTPQVWPLQVDMTVGRGAVQQQCLKALRLHILNEAVGVQWHMHGIARLGMGQLKLQVGSGGQTVPGAAQCDTRIGKAAQTIPELLGVGSAHAAPVSASRLCLSEGASLSARRLLSRWKIYMSNSHCSNSGAGLTPIIWRITKASWKEVLW